MSIVSSLPSRPCYPSAGVDIDIVGLKRFDTKRKQEKKNTHTLAPDRHSYVCPHTTCEPSLARGVLRFMLRSSYVLARILQAKQQAIAFLLMFHKPPLNAEYAGIHSIHK
jgi:hypothetical protein